MPTSALPRISVRADVGIGPYGRTRRLHKTLFRIRKIICKSLLQMGSNYGIIGGAPGSVRRLCADAGSHLIEQSEVPP